MLSLFPLNKTVYKAILQKLFSVIKCCVILRKVLKTYQAACLGYWHFSVGSSWIVNKMENIMLGKRISIFMLIHSIHPLKF